MITIRRHVDVLRDLEEIILLDRLAATRIIAFLEQYANDPLLLQKLTTHGYRNEADNLDVKKWKTMQSSGHPVWRLRFVDFAYRVPDYRIFYVPAVSKMTVHVLAIGRKSEIDYDNPDFPMYRRILRASAELRASGEIGDADIPE